MFFDIEHIFDEKSLPEVLDNINDYLNKLFSRSYSYKDFTITKGLTRDNYKQKPAHCLLADKMKKRGINVPVGSKVSYVLTTSGGNKYNVKQHEKIEDEDYFGYWREILRVDFLYIFEKQAIKPIDEILETVYPKFRDRDVSYMKSQFLIRREKEYLVKRIYLLGEPKIVFEEQNKIKEIRYERKVNKVVSDDEDEVLELNE